MTMAAWKARIRTCRTPVRSRDFVEGALGDVAAANRGRDASRETDCGIDCRDVWPVLL